VTAARRKAVIRMDKAKKIDRPPRTRKPVQPGRIVGYVLIIFGCANIIDWFSPIPIPTVGMSAIITGLLCIAAGSFLLIRDKAGLLRRIGSRLARRTAPSADLDPMLPVRILKLARERRGVLTMADVAVDLAVPLARAEAGLLECVRTGHATADFDMDREIKYYRFHEYLPPPDVNDGDALDQP
jgi:hypothetical protein